MISFLLTFFLVYGGAHLYAFLRMKALLPGRASGSALALFMGFMVAAPALVRLGERAGLEASARLLAWGGYLWMGFLFLFFAAALALDSWRLFLLLARLLTGLGRYWPALRVAWISRRNSATPSVSIASRVFPSTPAAPLFARTRLHASHRTSPL